MKLQDKQHNTSVLPLVYRPEWVEQATEPCRWDEDGKFWYQNQEDYQCGLSYRQRLDHPVPQEWDSPSQGVTWHEELRATIIDGKAWCSVHDASLLAGVTCPYSSESGQGDQVMVRFKADLVQPDNLRDLFPQGINDYGIRIEALVPIFTKARNGDQLLKWLTGTVIPQLYGNSASQIGEKPPVYVFRMGQPAGPAPVGEVRINSLNGEMRAVVIGSRLCYRLDDAAQLLSLDPKALAAMVGVHSVIAVDCQQAGDDPTHKGHPGYIAYSTLKKILKAVDYGDDIIWELMECAGPHLKQSQWQTTVSARLLHRMIGRDISFAAWSSEVYNEHDMLDWESLHPQVDFPITLTQAMAIARSERTFAGEVTYCLLADGGFLHGGPWNETPDATLMRFHKLLPDQDDCVDARSFHEFLNWRQPSDGWTGECGYVTDRNRPYEPISLPASRAGKALFWQAGPLGDSLKKFRSLKDKRE